MSRINRLEITVFNKGPQINRAFWYVHDILGYSRYGKDIRLYGAEKMLTRKGEECFCLLYTSPDHSGYGPGGYRQQDG